MKFEPEDILEITKILEPHFKIIFDTAKKELQRQIAPELLNTKYAAYLLGLKSESTLIKRKNEGKYHEGWHYIIERSEKKNGNILWHRDHLLLEEFDKSKGIAK